MKKIFIIITLFFVSVSLFSQESEESEAPKNTLRIHSETLFVFPNESNAWADRSCDYSITGLGISYSRLFSDNVGMTFVLGTLLFGMEDPFNQTENIRLDSGEYRTGGYFKIGPYFKFDKIALSTTLDLTSVSKNSKDDFWGVSDQLAGVSVGLDFFVTDSFLIFVEGSVLIGYRFDEDWWLYNDPDDESSRLMAASLSIGVGFSF